MLNSMNESYYEHFKTFIPDLKRQYFIAKLQDNIRAILDIKDNIWKNWNLTLEQKKKILKEIGITE